MGNVNTNRTATTNYQIPSGAVLLDEIDITTKCHLTRFYGAF